MYRRAFRPVVEFPDDLVDACGRDPVDRPAASRPVQPQVISLNDAAEGASAVLECVQN